MDDYTAAERLITDAWGKRPDETVAQRLDRLIREGKINGNDIIVLVHTALSTLTE